MNSAGIARPPHTQPQIEARECTEWGEGSAYQICTTLVDETRGVQRACPRARRNRPPARIQSLRFSFFLSPLQVEQSRRAPAVVLGASPPLQPALNNGAVAFCFCSAVCLLSSAAVLLFICSPVFDPVELYCTSGSIELYLIEFVNTVLDEPR
jgi:hypothetical protein